MKLNIKGLEIRMREGTSVSDICIIDPLDSWSVELAIKTDYHFAEENPTMPSQDIHPLKSNGLFFLVLVLSFL